MSTVPPFPIWLEPAWQQLLQSWRDDRLAHALLFGGPAGLGKQRLAERLTGLLLCATPTPAGDACGQCQSCGWLQVGSHPDLTRLMPEETGKAIKVDQVRDLCIELGMTSHAGRYKVAIVAPAEAMNANAANSLLKTLEEPTPQTVLILLSEAPGRLLPTVRSRCRALHVGPPPHTEAAAWLKAAANIDDPERYLRAANGAPLAAADLAAGEVLVAREQRLRELIAVHQGRMDPLKLAADWYTEQNTAVLQWWSQWLQMLIRYKLAQVSPAETEYAANLCEIAASADSRQLFELSDRIMATVSALNSGLNRQLAFEDLLIRWARLAAPPGLGRRV